MLHCARHADYYDWGNSALFLKSPFAFTQLAQGLGATLAAAPAAFEFYTIFLRPFWQAIYHSS